MKSYSFKRRIARPLWHYLNQPLFDPAQPLHLLPQRFWSAYQMRELERCWQINPLQQHIDFLEECWHLHRVKR